jgi:hypothetical protein
MPHSVGNFSGISYTRATALLLAMCSDGVASLFLLVFHRCEEHPVDRRRFEEGFVTSRWRCPVCEQDVEPGSLTYALECDTLDAIHFE